MKQKKLMGDQILRHLELAGDITALIATKEYGTTDLRDQIYFLRKRLKAEGKGRFIQTTFHRSPVNDQKYAKYHLRTTEGSTITAPAKPKQQSLPLKGVARV